MDADSTAPRRALPLILLLAPLFCLAGCARPYSRTPFEEPIRGIWVTRWDYKTPHDIRRIIDNARSLKLNTIFFQVRGQGTVAYSSRLEPWSNEFGGRDPGFDPLRVAVRQAHRRGIALHAWINVMPSWKGKKPPRDPRQLYNARPNWHLYDARGRRQPLSDHYVILNPALPEVRRYLAALCAEITENYDVDGLHLDYIRFVTDESGAGRDYPHDRRTLQLYRNDTKLTPSRDRRRWDDWRRQRITQLVKEIRDAVRRTAPNAALTAAVIGDRSRARDDMFQDAEDWLKKGYLDAVCPMAYRDSPAEFRRLIGDWRDHAPGRLIIPGIGIYNHNSDRVSFEQLRSAARWGDGFVLFAYSSFFPSPRQASDAESRRARQRLRNLAPMLAKLAQENSNKTRSNTWLAALSR